MVIRVSAQLANSPPPVYCLTPCPAFQPGINVTWQPGGHINLTQSNILPPALTDLQHHDMGEGGGRFSLINLGIIDLNEFDIQNF